MFTILLACLLIQPVPGPASDPAFHPASHPESHPPSATRADTTIRTADLKAYQGYYKFQFEKGTDSYIHIGATEKGLVLQQMWDGKEITFTPQSALEFINEDGNFPLKFTKETNGSITQVLAFNKDLWIKTNDYKPVVTKEVQLKPSELKALEGRYTMQNDHGDATFLQIRATDKGLILKQEWDGGEIPFVATSDVTFYCKEHQFPLKFTKDKNGIATQVLAFDRDLWTKVKE